MLCIFAILCFVFVFVCFYCSILCNRKVCNLLARYCFIDYVSPFPFTEINIIVGMYVCISFPVRKSELRNGMPVSNFN